MAYPTSWQKKALVTITPQGGDNYEYWSLSENIKVTDPPKDLEQIVLLNGGRIAKNTPAGIGEISIDMYPVGVDPAYGIDMLQNGETFSGTYPALDEFSDSQTPMRLAVLWTSDTSVTSATAATSVDYPAYRFYATDVYITNVEYSFTDGILKVSVTFKFVPFDKAGNSNYKKESTDGSVALSALSSY